ncbi:hypothetical protein Y032_0397g703 [Ancylostoma ceylanicum]|uniref:Uncharacterized protein n=1 Tax=Ancylostoma ceylanicum TaxID=53326 RepID=A0A016RSF4_9BILA|nr:hypothetical protein Y032_0397g703 [Ancylostoma ceylanicum]
MTTYLQRNNDRCRGHAGFSTARRAGAKRAAKRIAAATRAEHCDKIMSTLSAGKVSPTAIRRRRKVARR